MKALLKLAFFTGIGTMAWKSWKNRPTAGGDDRGAVGSSGVVRDAGPAEQRGIDNHDWDVIDEQVDESFPASDPPGNFRGIG